MSLFSKPSPLIRNSRNLEKSESGTWVLQPGLPWAQVLHVLPSSTAGRRAEFSPDAQITRPQGRVGPPRRSGWAPVLDALSASPSDESGKQGWNDQWPLSMLGFLEKLVWLGAASSRLLRRKGLEDFILEPSSGLTSRRPIAMP
ncbi:hypothetical protein JX265_013617 [Neoarthrinium moseri]|uniref:Uncharacterized protein n=1 Tax=Neoarthrinium moseri TaxID=1658444 RepID=A0A9P9W8D7_9PEZI|nr:uncharacterized protein JN550_005176 [Neoarthrinium moseri]KAI1840265.1 hypothetical protein JX266_013518 [Neoarthrinium moseri]KAI1849552.1 hypothetical protein JX265_013617 [Neoarthrinium moseri]KAI1870633.1 hypothetical protein JN550_005176 [Neoarthrinium moseri]